MPEDIKKNSTPLSEEDDEEMPEPKTKTYQQVCVLKPKFREMLASSLGTLGYAQVVGTVKKNFQVQSIFKLIDDKNGKLLIPEMNQMISLLAMAPFNLIAPLMHLIEKPEGQNLLWEIREE